MTYKENILGYMVDTCGLNNCVSQIIAAIESGTKSRWLACLNPHSYAIAVKDNDFSCALRGADWLIPDGVGIVFASRWQKGKIQERVTGSDIFWNVQLALNRQLDRRIFLLGSTPENLAAMRARLQSDFPYVHVAGMYSPPFKPTFSIQEADDMVAAVNAAAPDVLWVGMSAPKQEKWIFQNRARINAKFCAAVGAVFDFYAGRIKRSHRLFQDLGLEWLPRLLQEPRRLWRRMFLSAPLFIWHILRYRYRSIEKR
jgi:N-acetylglucosaminyldiphosphoundecaprenol N-acetyl-beta-D-mannosaminyltransferase